MNQQEKQDKFIEIYCIKRLNCWEAIAEEEKSDIETMKKTYKKIDNYLSEKCGSSPQEIKEFYKLPLLDEINTVFTKFTSDRKTGFKTFENFYLWFSNQPKNCHYCKTSEVDLIKLFNNVFKPKKEAWKNGTLQIEKKEPDKGYIPENCVLACVLCNNAKSDLITDKDFEVYFAEPMRLYLLEQIKKTK